MSQSRDYINQDSDYCEFHHDFPLNCHHQIQSGPFKVYDGPHAFSEPESAGARDKINEHISNMGAFFSLHTYGQLWLVPYSFSGTEKPEDIDQVQV